ncbi:reverse transcriptase [Corchorus capsularis]|uniref:Reverse transcriptase n=1 Tax=Corchorus capsularis TaxID=210143 RepID=A0A1R3KX75_COCAP|nr:reverse transcriptase [Corchorus capsularis]
MNNCAKELSVWDRESFGNVKHAIVQKKREFNEVFMEAQTGDTEGRLQRCQEELNDLYKNEEVMWRQRSKAFWLRDGDKNTRYFHSLASARRNRNMISRIRNSERRWMADFRSIEDEFVGYYRDMFSSSNPIRAQVDLVVEKVKVALSSDMRDHLGKDFTSAEICQAVFDMNPNKPPGHDGMTPMFYQKFLGVVGDDVIMMALRFSNEGIPFPDINDTCIASIPKIDSPVLPKDYRPISLCNVVFKIISKALANRLRTILPELTGENQSVFVPNRVILDSAMVAFETVHIMKNKVSGRKKHMALKLDLSKAYDTVEWCFLESLMHKMGFPSRWISNVMYCIRTVTYSIIINGQQSECIVPSRGIRQGDPNTSEDLRANIMQRLEVGRILENDKYLGLPIMIGRSRRRELHFIKDRLWSRVRSWNGKLLSIVVELFGSYDFLGSMLVLRCGEVGKISCIVCFKKLPNLALAIECTLYVGCYAYNNAAKSAGLAMVMRDWDGEVRCSQLITKDFVSNSLYGEVMAIKMGIHLAIEEGVRNCISSNFVQPYITRAWELKGEATVMGRERDRYLIHFNNTTDRQVGVKGNPWCMDGAIMMDDGDTRWIQFSYERIDKFCLSCGLIGHTHPNCNIARIEVDRRINSRLIRVSEAYGYPIVVDEENHFLSNQMRAFRNRASRRNTRIICRQNQNRGALRIDENQTEVRVRLDSEIMIVPECSSKGQWQSNLDAQIINLQTELSALTPAPILQPEPLQIRPPHANNIEESSQYPPFEPIMDPLFEFHNTIDRVQHLYERHEGGFQNLADYEDMLFAMAREQSRFEHVCAEMAKHSAIVKNSVEMVQEQGEEQEQQGVAPDFRCSVNEDEMVAAFLKDSPSPEEEKPKAVKQNSGEDGKGKRARGDEDTPSGTELEDGKRIRQRMQGLEMEERNQMEIEDTRDKGDWGFNSCVGVNSQGLSGGYLLLLKDDVKVSILSINKNLSLLYLHYKDIKMWLTCIYGHPELSKRGEVWEQLKNMRRQIPQGDEWLVMGDFNQVLHSKDKLSESSNQIRGAEIFKQCLNECGLAEVANKGLHFTWSNRREEGRLTWERLDREFAYSSWFQKFENATLTNLPITVSDHNPLVMQLGEMNTRFFHTMTNRRRAWSKIASVEKRDRQMTESIEELKKEFMDHFREVFSNEGEASEQEIRASLESLAIPELTNEHKQRLGQPFNREECVSTVSYQILLNGGTLPRFEPKRGLRASVLTARKVREIINKYCFLSGQGEELKTKDFSMLDREDELVWRNEFSGCFTVKSAHREILMAEMGNQVDFSRRREWKALWKLKLPFKIIIFLWKMCNKGLPTRLELTKRGMNVDSRCGLCSAHEESQEHLFWNCDVARAVWFGSSLSLRTKAFEQVNIVDWLMQWLAKTNPTEVGESHFTKEFAVTLWMIWIHKNECLFEGASVNPLTIIQRSRGYCKTIVITFEDGNRLEESY